MEITLRTDKSTAFKLLPKRWAWNGHLRGLTTSEDWQRIMNEMEPVLKI